MKITIAGAGYVGMSLAVLFALHHETVVIDPLKEKINLINRGKSPVKDLDIQQYLRQEKLHLYATTVEKDAYKNADYIVIATPTDYDPVTNEFDTSSIENVIDKAIVYAKKAVIVIKSTVPVGYTKKLCERYQTDQILFSPEFLREDRALHDNLYPSRIIVGSQKESYAKKFADLLKEGAKKVDIPTLYMNLSEAEAVKLFANTYLALRISFFNELDSYSQVYGLDSKQIIDGVGLDSRIGMYYHNPSFGYGGYCLPKDTKQLLANYQDVPENIIGAVVKANKTRKDFIAEQILGKIEKHFIVGVYRLTMKKDSDNFRHSSVLGIIKRLKQEEVKMVIYEPLLNESVFDGIRVVSSIEEFKQISDLIIANRYANELDGCMGTVYTRDIYGQD
jgi:UDPglucose 6-dehydrogenase